MKKTLLVSIIVAIIALTGGFVGGWYANNKSEQKQQEAVSKVSNDFMYNLFSHQNDKAYSMTSKNYQDSTTMEQFNKNISLMNDQNLEPGITSTYKNGSAYMVTQEYIDKDGKTKNVAVIDIVKQGKVFVITNVSAN